MFLVVVLPAQTVDLSGLGTGVKSLAGEWKFHKGDDPRWADPNFDDSNWKRVRVPLNLARQGYSYFSGFGWYRLTLNNDEPHARGDLALAVGPQIGAYEVRANGTSIGRMGLFPPHERVYPGRLLSFKLPDVLWTPQGKVVVSIRYWRDPRYAWRNEAGLTGSPIEIGQRSLIENLLTARKHSRIMSFLPTALVKLVELFLATALMAIYLLDRRPEYFWFGLTFALDSVGTMLEWSSAEAFLLTSRQGGLFSNFLNAFWLVPAVLGVWLLLDLKAGRLSKLALYSYVAFCFFYCYEVQAGYHASNFFVTYFSVNLCGWSTVIAVVLYRCRVFTGSTRWLALSFLPVCLTSMIGSALELDRNLTRFLSDSAAEWASDASWMVTVAAFGFFLLRRFGSARAEQERLHTEMETARQVQRLMLPSQSVTIPNIGITAVYLPAQEIGGDFFQISQTNDGSLLMIVGDVSGKGLKAALTVSLLVGLWQDAIDAEQSPSNVLGRLNEHLLSRMSDGFVSCLCVSLKIDGSLEIANAGHLAPYINGIELATANGLPLGMTSDVEYAETSHRLASGDVLVLISDGVVEARDKARKLYGFERLQRALSEKLSAHVIATQVQSFGQEDDITVISISRHGAEAERATAPDAVQIAL